jgi:hypothetical protein
MNLQVLAPRSYWVTDRYFLGRLKIMTNFTTSVRVGVSELRIEPETS